jgi:uncharacterized protein YndB with AHSA1/START domain
MPTSPDPDHAETTVDDAPLDAVRREVVLDATPERVWAALADDEGLSGWLADEVDLEVREGATGTVRDGDGPRRDVAVEEVVAGRRLGLSWWDVDGRETVVDLALETVEEGRTRVVVVEVPRATLRLVAPAAERLLAGGRPGGPSATGSAPTARAPRVLAGAR